MKSVKLTEQIRCEQLLIKVFFSGKKYVNMNLSNFIKLAHAQIQFLQTYCSPRQFVRFTHEVMSKPVSRSTSFKSNNDYSLQLNRWYLIPIGVWPRINSSSIACEIFVLLHIFICLIVVALIMIPCTLFVLFEKVNIKLKLSAIGPLLHRVMGSVNYWMLLKRSSDIRKLIRHMETDWKIIHRVEDREVMLQYAKFGRFVAGICGVIMHGGTFLFSIARAIKTVPIIVGNDTFRMHPMTCPIYSKIILVIQFLSTFIVSSSTVGACSLAAVFAMHACGQLNVLYTWLHQLVENQKENRIAERKLATIVEHHLRVLRYVNIFSRNFRQVYFIYYNII